jgi:transposase
MLSFAGSLRVFIALDPCDMRAGMNTLHAVVAEKLKEDSGSGALFVFTNKRRRLLKILYFDGTGLWMRVLSGFVEADQFWTREGGGHPSQKQAALAG